ncbi:MAG: FAD/NAD(P)-binding oxidoreductase [Thermodesulfovibrionales bacterium]|nr:FAD/NAD(P)-binding oxidoreductase [Thermodesulfovibrionales bacterium]
MSKRIVIIGGGAGGTITANLLARNLYRQLISGKVLINMITDRPDHIYQPGFLYIPFDKMREDEIVRRQSDLIDPHINLFVDPAVKIDRDNNVVITQSGREFPYDYLVIATGSRIMPDLIPGLREGAHWFYDIEGALKLRNALKTFDGGRVVITVGVPHKCPVAPLEMTFMLYDYFKQKGILDKTELYYTYPINRLHALEPVSNWTVPVFEKKGIKYETLFNMEEIDPVKKVLRSMEGSEVNYDLLITIPPHKGAEVVINSGLDKDGWIKTDKKTLKNEGYNNVYVVGDTTNIPISKAGSTAHFEADVVAERLSVEINGGDSSIDYDGKVVCFVETGFDEATYVWFNYNTPPSPTPPSRMLHWMKLGYNRLYWLSARGIL